MLADAVSRARSALKSCPQLCYSALICVLAHLCAHLCVSSSMRYLSYVELTVELSASAYRTETLCAVLLRFQSNIPITPNLRTALPIVLSNLSATVHL
jgi:hypothetical protein